MMRTPWRQPWARKPTSATSFWGMSLISLGQTWISLKQLNPRGLWCVWWLYLQFLLTILILTLIDRCIENGHYGLIGVFHQDVREQSGMLCLLLFLLDGQFANLVVYIIIVRSQLRTRTPCPSSWRRTSSSDWRMMSNSTHNCDDDLPQPYRCHSGCPGSVAPRCYSNRIQLLDLWGPSRQRRRITTTLYWWGHREWLEGTCHRNPIRSWRCLSLNWWWWCTDDKFRSKMGSELCNGSRILTFPS